MRKHKILIVAIIKENKTALEAADKIRTVTYGIIKRLRDHKQIPAITRDLTITSLKHNIDFMVCLGDPSWKIQISG